MNTLNKNFLNEFFQFAKENNVFGSMMAFMIGTAGQEVSKELIKTIVDPIINYYNLDKKIPKQYRNLFSAILSLVLTLVITFFTYRFIQQF